MGWQDPRIAWVSVAVLAACVGSALAATGWPGSPEAVRLPAPAFDRLRAAAAGPPTSDPLTDDRAAAPAVLQMRPGHATTFRVGLVESGDVVTLPDSLVDDADIDLLGAPAGGLENAADWAGYRGVLAWRTDTWRLVRASTVHVPGASEPTPVPLVRLANRQSTRWIWVAVLPPDIAVAPVERRLADRLRPHHTPFLFLAATRVRFSGEGVDVVAVDHPDASLRAGRVLVPAT
jgi:hypothetical protein